MPEGLTVGIQRKQRRCERSRLQRFNPFGRPVHVREAKPEGEFVERQRQCHSEHDGDPEMPLRRARRERDEAGEHQEQNAPEQMMDVKAAPGDEIPERPVRKQLEVNDRGDHPQDAERDEKRNQRADGDAAAEIEPAVMMSQPHPPIIPILRLSNPSDLIAQAVLRRFLPGPIVVQPEQGNHPGNIIRALDVEAHPS
jgi:hypothetical protein